jgi:hypothetical protein
LLPAHPGAMLIRDALGHIPFEGSLVDWVDFSHQHGKTTKDSRAGSTKLSSLTQVWESTSHTVRSAVRLAGRQIIKVTNDGQDAISSSSPFGRDPSTGENPRFVFQTAEEASDAHINLGTEKSSTGGLQEGAYKASTFPPNVRLTDRVRFVLVMLSATIDQLDRYMSPEVYQNGLSESEEDSFCRAMRELSTFRELYGTIDISATVVQIGTLF